MGAHVEADAHVAIYQCRGLRLLDDVDGREGLQDATPDAVHVDGLQSLANQSLLQEDGISLLSFRERCKAC